MATLQLLPAVDVADGQAVRLVQGEAGSETTYGDPLEAALAWQRAGAEWMHLVDLDAAFGRGSNRELLAEVVGALDVDVELSGGIRDDESLAAALATGCRRVNLGTAALETPEWCARAIAEHGDRIAVGLDVRGTRWPRAAGPARAASCTRRSPGWTPRAAPATSSPTSPRTAPCAGPNLELLREVCARHRRGRSSPRAGSARWTTSARWPGWRRSASRARSSARRSTPGRSPWRRRCAATRERARVSVLRFGSGGPWEAMVGYSRVVVRGDSAWVSGLHVRRSTARCVHPGDVAAQARQAFANLTAALESAGLHPRRRRPHPHVPHRHRAGGRSSAGRTARSSATSARPPR